MVSLLDASSGTPVGCRSAGPDATDRARAGPLRFERMPEDGQVIMRGSAARLRRARRARPPIWLR